MLRIGGLVAIEGGYLLSGQAKYGWFAAVNHWGHHNCQVVGGCINKTKASDCDDLNPCTADVCNAKTPNGQCLHPPLSGIPCGLGKTCKAGVCS